MDNVGGFKETAFKDLFEREEKSFWFNSRNKLILYFLKKYFPDMVRYLEIGCGTGFVLRAVEQNFPACKVSGSELFEEGLKYAKIRVPNANLIQLNAVEMDSKAEYDVFGAFDVLEHIKEDEKVLSNLNGVIDNSTIQVNRGGLITVPQHMFMWSSADDEACHVRRYSQKELRAKLEATGFKVERMTGFVSLLFPFMMVSRLISGKQKKGGAELSLPAWMNAIFSFIMRIEFFLIRLGINFPFGGSIIAVVTK